MAVDLFNNPSNDYINPGLSPCPGSADDQFLTWTENGLAIIKGSNIISELDFNDLAVPVESFNKQQILLQSGEVAFIPGLTKGLLNRSQGFTMPELTSDDLDLNSFFFQIDFSLNYYRNFGFVNTNIEASSNYGQNISIEDALNILFGELGVKVTASYDPSIMTFSGTTVGYEFNVSNVLITLVDSSADSSSPFPNGQNAETYDLLEDPSADVPYAKYPNTAMQGIALKGIYPSGYAECELYVLLNHVSDYVVTYDPFDLTYDSDVSTNLIINYDPLTYIGTPPTITLGVDDVSDLTIDGSVLTEKNVLNCDITNSILTDCSIGLASLVSEDSSITGAVLMNSWINAVRVLINPSVGYFYSDDVSLGRVYVDNVQIWDSSIKNAVIYDSSIYRSSIKDSSLYGCTTYNCTFDSITVADAASRDIMIDPSLGCLFEIVQDTSTYYMRARKKLEVGMSGCSLGEVISAGDYLNMVTLNDLWRKVGEVYIWISSPDCEGSTTKKLIDGFYVYNPHDFPVQIEYMTIV